MSKIQGMTGKDAVVIQDPDNPVPKVINFQYNTESLLKSFQRIRSSIGSRENDSSDIFTTTKLPRETFNMKIKMNATDKLEFPDKISSITDQSNFTTIKEDIEIEATRIEMKINGVFSIIKKINLAMFI